MCTDFNFYNEKEWMPLYQKFDKSSINEQKNNEPVQTRIAKRENEAENLLIQQLEPNEKANSIQTKKETEKEEKLQESSILYEPIETFKIKLFEEDVHLFLKKNIEELRISESNDKRRTDNSIPQRTCWNFDISEKIRVELLIILESFSYKLRQTSIENPEAEDFKNQSIVDLRNFKNNISKQIGSKSSLYGLPMKFNHLDRERIWRDVKDTEFYDRVQEDSELVLSVACFGYPGCFFSIWIFVGHIAKGQD